MTNANHRIRLATIYHLAADYFLEDGIHKPTKIPQTEYSCNAVNRVLEHIDHHKTFGFAREEFRNLGMPEPLLSQFHNPNFVERQSTRYLWLKFVAMSVGDRRVKISHDSYQKLLALKELVYPKNARVRTQSPVYKIKYADVVIVAADVFLRHEDNNKVRVSQYTYTCDAIRSVFDQISVTYDRTKTGIQMNPSWSWVKEHHWLVLQTRLCGLNPGSVCEFDEFDNTQDRQNARMLWLHMFAVYLEDDDFIVPKRVFDKFQKIKERVLS